MRFRRQSGFSLIESLVTMSILGLLLGLGIPAFRHYNSTIALRRSSERILEEMRRARQRSANEHNNYVVTFNTSSGTMQIHDDDNNNGVIDGGERVRTVTLLSGVTFSSVDIVPADSLVFTLLGTLRNPNGGGSLSLAGADGAGDTLYVSAVGHISRS